MTKVLALCGSLRKGSYNAALLRAAQELCPEGMAITAFSPRELPLYDDDVRVAGYPEQVLALRAAVSAADGILFVSPEYNYSIPGVLKNAIDWVSRPPEPPFAGKPAAVMSAATGMLGGARMQYHLRQVAVFVDLHMMNKPEVMVPRAAEKFDAELKLTDAPTRQALEAFLKAFQGFIRRVQRGAAG